VTSGIRFTPRPILPGKPERIPGRKLASWKVKLACKPGSVGRLAAPRQSFIWAGSCLPARATYPGAARATLVPPYLVLLRMGFALPPLSPGARWALTPPFHPCPHPNRAAGGMFSVALSIASRRPAVSRHPALRSPDFPLRKRIAQRLPGQLLWTFYIEGHSLLALSEAATRFLTGSGQARSPWMRPDPEGPNRPYQRLPDSFASRVAS